MGPPGPVKTRLDIGRVEKVLTDFYSFRLASATQKCYSAGQKRFLTFCVDSQLNPLPLSEHTILLFITHLGLDGLSLSTMKSYISAIRNMLINNGLPNVNFYTPKVTLVLRGIKRWKASTGYSPNPRLAITPYILLKLKQVWGSCPISNDCHMLWAAMCVAFFGFLCCAEFTVPASSSFDPSRHLTLRDIDPSISTPVTTITICVKHSKTNQFGKGVDIHLARTGDPLCPVSALLDYLSIRGSRDGPLFLTSAGKPLYREVLVEWLRSALSSCSFNPNLYCGHSFRIGAATTALKAGISDAKITSNSS